jgi:restriction system protein
MSNISRRRVGELQRGVFKILLEQAEGLAAKEIIKRMEQIVPPTEFERSDYPKHPGTQRFGKIIRFATIGPVKAGWLIKEKGRLAGASAIALRSWMAWQKMTGWSPAGPSCWIRRAG